MEHPRDLVLMMVDIGVARIVEGMGVGVGMEVDVGVGVGVFPSLGFGGKLGIVLADAVLI